MSTQAQVPQPEMQHWKQCRNEVHAVYLIDAQPQLVSFIGRFADEALAKHVAEQHNRMLEHNAAAGISEAPAPMPRFSISFENSTLLKALRVAVTRTATIGDRHTKYARLVLQLFGDQLSRSGVKETPDFREVADFARDFTDMNFGDTRSRGHSAEAAEAMTREVNAAGPNTPVGETVSIHKPQSVGKTTDVMRLSRELLDETRKPVVLAGADINSGGLTMHISGPSLDASMDTLDAAFRLGGFVDEFDSWRQEDKVRVQALTSSLPCKAFTSAGSAVDRHTRGRAAILAKLVEWRRSGEVEFLGFYADAEEDGGVQDARDIFSIQGVVDLGELIEAFAMAAAGLNAAQRLGTAEQLNRAQASAIEALRGLLDRQEAENASLMARLHAKGDQPA